MNELARSSLARFREIAEQLASPEVLSNRDKLRELGKERAELEELATVAEEYERVEKALAEAREILQGSDQDLRELAEADDPETRAAELEAEFREKFAHPYLAAKRGFLDDVIDPRETRARLISGLEALQNKRQRNPPRKHGNIPL